MTGVATHECQSQSRSEGFSSQAASGTPRPARGLGQATGVQMTDVQCDAEGPCKCVAYQVALQLVPIDLAAPRGSPLVREGNTDALDPGAVVTWTEEQLLELATSLPAVRTIRHQPRGLRQRTCTVLKKLLQHHTRCHHQWVKRRDSESLQAELAAARWALLGPTLLVRACDGGEHADDEGLTPGQRRKLSIKLVGKRATLAETGVD